MLTVTRVKNAVEWNQFRSITHSFDIQPMPHLLECHRPNYLGDMWLGDLVLCNGVSYTVLREVVNAPDITEVPLQQLYKVLQQIT